MRTTIDIADDMLYLAKDFARRDKKTLGEVVTELLRKAVQTPDATVHTQGMAKKKLTETEKQRRLRDMGWVTLPNREDIYPKVTNELVNRIREEEGI
jgi:hypothetical protein